MKRVKTFTPNNVNRLRKVVDRIDKLHAIIKQANEELHTINTDHIWVRYLTDQQIVAGREGEYIAFLIEQIIDCEQERF